MVKIISFEGCVGAGKTTLTNYFSREFKVGKIKEEYYKVPFIEEFYPDLKGELALETEMSFLLIHYHQVKKALNDYQNHPFIFADFDIEKDYVYAKMNLLDDEFKLFSTVYEYIIKKIGVPKHVIYLDLPEEFLKRRIFQRGRNHEINTKSTYFMKYNNQLKKWFKQYSKTAVSFFDVSDLDLDPKNDKLSKIKNYIIEVTQ